MLLQFIHLVQADSNYTIPSIFGKVWRIQNVGASSITVYYGSSNVSLGAGLYRDFWYDGTDWQISQVTDFKIRTSAPSTPTAGDLWIE